MNNVQKHRSHQVPTENRQVDSGAEWRLFSRRPRVEVLLRIGICHRLCHCCCRPSTYACTAAMAASAHHAQVLPFLLHSFFSPSSSSPIVVSFSGSWHALQAWGGVPCFKLVWWWSVVLVPGLFSWASLICSRHEIPPGLSSLTNSLIFLYFFFLQTGFDFFPWQFFFFFLFFSLTQILSAAWFLCWTFLLLWNVSLRVIL